MSADMTDRMADRIKRLRKNHFAAASPRACDPRDDEHRDSADPLFRVPSPAPDAALTAPDQSGPDYWKVSWREPNKEHQFKILPSKALAFEWAERIHAEHGIIIEHVVEAIEPGGAE